MAAACAPPEESEEAPVRISRADAAEILDLADYLPFHFYEVDAAPRGVSREALGLGSDATRVRAYRSSEPYQLLYCFLRIVESDVQQRQVELELNDQEAVRLRVRSFFQVAADRNADVTFTEPEMEVTYPQIANGGVLAQGWMKMDDYTLIMTMLRFRSSDPRVFGYVHSWHVTEDPPGSVLATGEEIESRIRELGR